MNDNTITLDTSAAFATVLHQLHELESMPDRHQARRAAAVAALRHLAEALEQGEPSPMVHETYAEAFSG